MEFAGLREIVIENFRSIDKLELTGLEDVNVINTGNDAGNTHVLDAVQLYASRGSPQVMREILLRDDELLNGAYYGPVLPDRDALFHGGDNGAEIRISGRDARLTLRVTEEDRGENTVTVSMQGKTRRVNLENRTDFRFHSHTERTPPYEPVTCFRVGPREPDNNTLVELYYPIALTEAEERERLWRSIAGSLRDEVQVFTTADRDTARRIKDAAGKIPGMKVTGTDPEEASRRPEHGAE